MVVSAVIFSSRSERAASRQNCSSTPRLSACNYCNTRNGYMDGAMYLNSFSTLSSICHRHTSRASAPGAPPTHGRRCHQCCGSGCPASSFGRGPRSPARPASVPRQKIHGHVVYALAQNRLGSMSSSIAASVLTPPCLQKHSSHFCVTHFPFPIYKCPPRDC